MTDVIEPRAKVAVRKRTLSEAAARHLMSNSEGGSKLSTEMDSEAARIKAGWVARAAKWQPDLILKNENGCYTAIECKSYKGKSLFSRILTSRRQAKA